MTRSLPPLLCSLLLALGCASAPTPPGDRPDVTATAPDESAEAADASPELANTIRWGTASEVDNFGFDVYRAESPDGPFERLNETAIEGGGTTDEPRKYRWVDDTIDPHRTYWYYVESISMTGERERFTPVGKAPPKIPPEGEDGDADP